MRYLIAILFCITQLVGGQATTGVSGRAGVSGTAALGNGTLGVSSIAIAPPNASVVQGSTVGYTATANLSNGNTQDVSSYAIWLFSDPTIANLQSIACTSGGGCVMNAICVSPGTTQVTALYARHSASTNLTCTANVPPVPTLVSIAVTPGVPSIGVGTSRGFTATGTYSDGSTQPLTASSTWASSNLTNATLGTLGITQPAICAHGGTSTISATDPATSIVGSTVLTCNAVLTSITVSPGSASILAGTTQVYLATCNFNDGSSANCSAQAAWTSSAPTKATIPASTAGSTNTATALAAGSTTITAAIGAISGTATLTVTNPGPPPPTLASLAITPAGKTINVGSTLDLIATCTYSDGSTQNCSALDPVSRTATVWTTSQPTRISLQLADAIAGTAYSTTLSGTGSTPRTWSVPAKTAPAGAVDILDWWLMPRANRDSFHNGGGSNPRYSVLNAGMAMGIKSSGGMPQDGRWYDDNYLYFGTTDNGDSADQAACVAAGYPGGCFLDPFAYKLALNVRPFSPRYFVLGGPDVTINDPAPNLGYATTNCALNAHPPRDLGNVATVTHDAGTSTNWGGDVGNAQTIIVNYYRSLTTLTPPYQSGSRERYYMAAGFGVFNYDSADWNGTAYVINLSNLNNLKVAGGPPTPNFGCGIPTPPIQGLPPGILSTSSSTMTIGDISGTISGTPNVPGTYPFIAQEEDGAGAFHLFPNTIRVAANAAAAQQTVLAVGAGASTITATIGAVSGNTTVTGQNPPPTLSSIAIAPATASILTSATQSFIATGTFSDGSQKDVTTAATWTSSSPSIATIPGSPTVSPNVATPVAAGSTTITAAIGAISGTATLTVTNPGPPPPTQTGVTLAPKPCSQLNGASCSYTLTENFNDGSTKDVTLTASAWTAGTPGNVQMASPFTNPETGKCLVGGGATSTVTGSFGGFSDNTTQTCTTAVATLQSIAVTPPNQSVSVGAIVSYTATGTYSDGSTKDLTAAPTVWSSSNAAIASIQSPAAPQPAKCNSAGGPVTIRATVGAVSGTTPLTCSTPPPPTAGFDGYCLSGTPTWGSNDDVAQLPLTCFNTDPANRPTTGTVRAVTTTTWNSVWAATNCDDVVEIAAGATITGPVTIPAKTCSAGHYRTLRVQGFNSSFPAYGLVAGTDTGGGVTPCKWGVASLPGYVKRNGTPLWTCTSPSNVGATIQTTSQSAALIITTPFSGLQIEGIHVLRNSNVFFSDVITQSGTAASNHLVLDRNWCSSTVPATTNRCFNESRISFVGMVGNFVSDFVCIAGGPGGLCSSDTQGFIDGLNSTGLQDATKKWVGNFVATASENLFSGGGGANIVPNDFEIRLNYLFKPMTWNPADPSYAFSAQPLVKNLLEFKNGNRILIEGNVLQNTWVGFDQDGSAMLMTPKSQSGNCPLCSVTNVTARYNYITNANYPWQFLAASSDSGAFATAANNFSFHDMVADNLGYATCFHCGGNSGHGFDGDLNTSDAATAPSSFVLKHVHREHNTLVRAPGAPNKAGMLGVSGPKPASGREMDDYFWVNNFSPNQRGGSLGVSNPSDGCTHVPQTACNCTNLTPVNALNACFVSYTFAGNCIVNNQSTVWPGTNVTTNTGQESTELVNYNNGIMLPGGDFHLKPGSVCHNQATDGFDPGADINTLLNRIAGVASF